ncbi:MAG TPA: hypothetical protein VN796_03470 [Acidimicrobiales bacterium]|nr:hypothetical protein [Acidimicrobiales bacterium]
MVLEGPDDLDVHALVDLDRGRGARHQGGSGIGHDGHAEMLHDVEVRRQESGLDLDGVDHVRHALPRRRNAGVHGNSDGV